MQPMPDSDLIGAPSKLFSTWDQLDVPALRFHERHFRNKAPELRSHRAFTENWGNCIKALKYKEDKAADFFSNQKQWLTDEEMTGEPSNFYWIWDVCELDALMRYRMQFATNAERFNGCGNFTANWKNCDAAIKYLRNNLAGEFIAADPDEPLKRAIRHGRAIRQNASFFAMHGDNLDCLFAFDHGKLLRETLLARINREIKEGKQPMLSVQDKECLMQYEPEASSRLDLARVKTLDTYEPRVGPNGSEAGVHLFVNSEENKKETVPREMRYFFNKPEINFV